METRTIVVRDEAREVYTMEVPINATDDDISEIFMSGDWTRGTPIEYTVYARTWSEART